MNKTNNSNRTVYGVSFKNHGKWTKNPNNLFSKTQVKQLSGLPRTADMAEHLAGFISYAAEIRKQPAKLIRRNA